MMAVEIIIDNVNPISLITDMKLSARERIIRAAISILILSGNEGLDVRSISKRAGTTPNRFYANFKLKEDLVLHIFELAWMLILRCIGDELLRTGGIGKDRLLASLRGIFRAWELDHELIEAVVVIENITRGTAIRTKFRGCDSYRTFLEALGSSREEMQLELKNDSNSEILIEFCFGGITRLLFIMTPLYGSAEKFNNKETRSAILRLFEETILSQLKKAQRDPEDRDFVGLPSPPG